MEIAVSATPGRSYDLKSSVYPGQYLDGTSTRRDGTVAVDSGPITMISGVAAALLAASFASIPSEITRTIRVHENSTLTDPVLLTEHSLHSGDAVPAHLVEALEELLSYQSLEPGWDGPESIAPSRELIQNVRQLLLALPRTAKIPEPMVSADGHVGLFWHDKDIYMSVDFFEVPRYRYYGKTGEYEISGVRFFDGRSVPEDIISLIC